MPFSDSEAGGGLRAATETVQTMFEDFQEPVIAGKMHSEILAMNWKRWRWYKTISPEERKEAMRIVDIAGRAKNSAAKIEYWKDPVNKAKISGKNNPCFGRTGEKSPLFGKKGAFSGRIHTDETKAKISAASIGKTMSEESCAKISAAKMGTIFTDEHKAKMSEIAKLRVGDKNPFFGKSHSEESKAKNRAAHIGENNSCWLGGISFEPYCPKFNEPLKESIRNRDNRTCVLCGTGEIQNGQRLSVHHIDSDKMQGCNGKSWYLCALCRSCNSRPDTIEKEFLIVTGGHGG